MDRRWIRRWETVGRERVAARVRARRLVAAPRSFIEYNGLVSRPHEADEKRAADEIEQMRSRMTQHTLLDGSGIKDTARANAEKAAAIWRRRSLG